MGKLEKVRSAEGGVFISTLISFVSFILDFSFGHWDSKLDEMHLIRDYFQIARNLLYREEDIVSVLCI